MALPLDLSTVAFISPQNARTRRIEAVFKFVMTLILKKASEETKLSHFEPRVRTALRLSHILKQIVDIITTHQS
jgi:hypothetical protein